MKTQKTAKADGLRQFLTKLRGVLRGVSAAWLGLAGQGHLQPAAGAGDALREGGGVAWRRREGTVREGSPLAFGSPFTHVCLIRRAVCPRDGAHALPSLALLFKMAVAVETACQPASYALPKPAACDMSRSERSAVWQPDSPGDVCCE